MASLKQRAENSGTPLSPEDEMAYKAIVAKIYGDLNPQAIIRLRASIPSLTSDTVHVVDVSIRSVQAGQEILTIVNAYPGSSLVDEGVVLEFAKILADSGASKGVLVCNASFTRPAKALAESLGIGLSSIQDAQSRRWREDIKIPVMLIKPKVLLHFGMKMNLDAGDVIPRTLDEYLFSTNNGTTTFKIMEVFTNLWDRNMIPHNPQESLQIKLDYSNWKFKLISPEKWREFLADPLVYKVTEEAWVKYHTPLEYTAIQDQLSDNINVASVSLDIPANSLLEQDETWIRVPDKNLFISRNKGVLVTFKVSIETLGDFKDEGMLLRKIENTE